MAAAWIWSSRTLILLDFNAHGMDLNAPGTNYRPEGKGCGPNQPPANVVWESRKISQAENHVETFFLKFLRAPA